MIELSVKHTKNFKIEIVCKDSDVLGSFMQFLTTEKISKPFKIKLKNGNSFFTKEKTILVKLYRKNGNKLTLNAGLADYVGFHIARLYKQYDIDLKFQSYDTVPIQLLPKWEKIFLSNPKGLEVGEMQAGDFKKLVAHNSGIAELYTGYGKTEFLLSVSESCQNRTVILAPNDTGVIAEILSRAKKYDVDVGFNDWTKQIAVVNPIVFMNPRNSYNTPEAREWLAGVKTCVGDECHHYSADSYLEFFELLTGLQRSYGFSASTDVEKGKKIKAAHIDIKDIGPKTGTIISMCGPVRISRTSKIPVSLFKVSTRIADVDIVKTSKDWSTALDQTLINYNMSRLIDKVVKIDVSKIFFIPIHKKESGETLYHNLIELGHTGILWTADDCLLNGQTVKQKNTLEYIKQLMRDSPVQFVMSTRLEGLDIPNLNAVIPLVGTNYRMTVQPIGRSARNLDLVIYLIYDLNNPITLSQARNRAQTIEREYNIVSSKRITIEI